MERRFAIAVWALSVLCMALAIWVGWPLLSFDWDRCPWYRHFGSLALAMMANLLSKSAERMESK